MERFVFLIGASDLHGFPRVEFPGIGHPVRGNTFALKAAAGARLSASLMTPANNRNIPAVTQALPESLVLIGVRKSKNREVAKLAGKFFVSRDCHGVSLTSTYNVYKRNVQ
jgi:hypothetical protein